MAEKFSHEILLKVVAQLCQMVGFEKIMTSVLHTLADILGAFLKNLGKTAQRYSEHCGRTLVNETDLSLAFYDFNIIPSELVEYLKLVSPGPEPLSVPKYPLVKNNQLSIQETPINMQDSNEKCKEVHSQLKENLKIKISLKNIKEACEAKKLKSKKLKKRKKNKENRKRKNKDS